MPKHNARDSYDLQGLRSGDGRDMLLPATLLDVAPKPLKDTNTQAAAKLDALERAEVALREASAAVDAAPRDDAQAAAAAHSDGKPLPDRTEPTRRAELDNATRSHQIVLDEARRALFALTDAIGEHQRELLDAQAVQVDRLAGEVLEVLTPLADRLGELAQRAAAMRTVWAYIPRPNDGGGVKSRSFRAAPRSMVNRPKAALDELVAAVGALCELPAGRTPLEEHLNPAPPTPDEENRRAWRKMAQGGLHIPAA